MTIAFTAASTGLIVMTVDSSVSLQFQDHTEYQKGRKSYYYPGVGCVTTWGLRDHNKIGQFLEKQDVSATKVSVVELADMVERYLKEEYCPHDLQIGEVGYHVAGFDRSGNSRVFHIFWGFDRPIRPDQTSPKYERYEHSPTGTDIIFLYNGRNDLAEVMIKLLISQMHEGRRTRFDTTTAVGLGCFGDFIARFAGEITQEVGPPFLTYLISMNNLALQIQNDSFSPIDKDVVFAKLKELGYQRKT